VPSDCLSKAILSLAACLSLYFGSQKIGTIGEATQTTPEPIKPAWLTLVYGSKSIDWIGDEKIMAAATSRGQKISFINADDAALEKLHLRPMVEAVGPPCLIFQGADGLIQRLAKVTTIDDVVRQIESIKN
jgi:hypothetical protein